MVNRKKCVNIIYSLLQQKISFKVNSGLQKVLKGGDQYEFFELLFNDTFLSGSMSLSKTNKYGEMILVGK